MKKLQLITALLLLTFFAAKAQKNSSDTTIVVNAKGNTIFVYYPYDIVLYDDAGKEVTRGFLYYATESHVQVISKTNYRQLIDHKPYELTVVNLSDVGRLWMQDKNIKETNFTEWNTSVNITTEQIAVLKQRAILK